MYLNINRVEFVITNQCSGRCKHCSVGDKLNRQGHLEYDKLKGVLTRICERFSVSSVMCFGGEPLLYYNEVKGILAEAAACGIAKRQIITNGFFTRDGDKIMAVVAALRDAQVNDILVSLDAFHQETIPIEPVYEFVRQLRENSQSRIRLHPAWVVNKEHDNPYNLRTKQLLAEFSPLGLTISEGNNIFPAGKALEFLSEYFPEPKVDFQFHCGDAPYSTDLANVNSISISPMGEVSICSFPIGNVYQENIDDILDRYQPYENPPMRCLLTDGVQGLIAYAKEQGLKVDLTKHYSACGVCKEIVDKIHTK